jgi:ribosomal protein L10
MSIGLQGFTATADTAVRPRLREGQAAARVVRGEAARYRCTGSPQDG